jgi:hypothetical protein
VVLVTATPHSGDDAAYRFLTSLGQTDGAPLRVFRRSRAPRDGADKRRSRLVHVWPTEAERLLLTETRAYVRALSRGASHPGARLLGSVIARRAASSAAAAARTLGRRIALLTHAAPLEQQPALPWPDVDEADDHVDDAVLAAPGLSDADREVEWLRLLARLAAAARHRSSKLGVIRRLIRRTNEPMLIFSEYRDVVIQVADGLADLCAVAMLHGGQSPRERLAAVTAFTSGAVRVLVATDAAGEGLNLHARCRLVINLELPWAPLRLEQRIGRVDRMGQARRVHALHLAHRDSYESTVIARLERRRLATLHASDECVGPSACSARSLRRLIASAADASPIGEHTLYAARPSRNSKEAVVNLLFTCAILDAGTHVVHQAVVPLRWHRPRTRRISRPHVRSWLRDPAIGDVLQAALRTHVARTQRLTAQTATALEQRVTALLAAGGRDLHAWQGALFDRRAEQRAERRHADDVLMQESLARGRERYRHLLSLHTAEPRLAAVWLSGR